MKSLYEEGKSLSEVGEIFGISAARVAQIFRLNNFKTRRRSNSKKFLEAMSKRRIVLDADLLEKLYVEQRLSIQKIADQLKINSSAVHTNLKKYKIPVRDIGKNKKSHLTAEILRRLHIDQKLTAAEIAERLNYTPDYVTRKLGELKIKDCGQDPGSSSLRNEEDKLGAPEFLTVKEIVRIYQIHEVALRLNIRKGIFPNAFRRRQGKTTLWMIPLSDLENFVPQLKGAVRMETPTPAAIRSRGKFARSKIKQLHGYGQAEIFEMIDLKNRGLAEDEIAVRFRVAEQLVADILEESALRNSRRKKPWRAGKELKMLSEQPLLDLYRNGRLSTEYILDKLNINYPSLYISLREHNIPLRNERLQLTSQEKNLMVYQLGNKENLPSKEVAERLGISPRSARKKIEEFNRQSKC